MAVFCLAIGMLLGGAAGLIMMAMFFVAKRADDNEIALTDKLTSVIAQQETT